MNIFKYIKLMLILLIMFFQQNIFAQSVDTGVNMVTYTRIMVGVVLLLITVVFIGLEIFGNAKYETEISNVSKRTLIVYDTILSSKFSFDKKLLRILNITFYFALLLLGIYLIMITIMLKIF